MAAKAIIHIGLSDLLVIADSGMIAGGFCGSRVADGLRIGARSAENVDLLPFGNSMAIDPWAVVHTKTVISRPDRERPSSGVTKDSW